MAKMKTALMAKDDTVVLGPLEFAAGMIATLSPEDVNKNGIVLASDRIKFMVDIDGKLVNVVASVYIQRDAVDETEAANVSKVAAERDAARKLKDEEAANKLAREKQAAFELGQQSTVSALRNIETLAAGAKVLHNLNRS